MNPALQIWMPRYSRRKANEARINVSPGFRHTEEKPQKLCVRATYTPPDAPYAEFLNADLAPFVNITIGKQTNTTVDLDLVYLSQHAKQSNEVKRVLEQAKANLTPMILLLLDPQSVPADLWYIQYIDARKHHDFVVEQLKEVFTGTGEFSDPLFKQLSDQGKTVRWRMDFLTSVDRWLRQTGGNPFFFLIPASLDLTLPFLSILIFNFARFIILNIAFLGAYSGSPKTSLGFLFGIGVLLTVVSIEWIALELHVYRQLTAKALKTIIGICAIIGLLVYVWICFTIPVGLFGLPFMAVDIYLLWYVFNSPTINHWSPRSVFPTKLPNLSILVIVLNILLFIIINGPFFLLGLNRYIR